MMGPEEIADVMVFAVIRPEGCGCWKSPSPDDGVILGASRVTGPAPAAVPM